MRAADVIAVTLGDVPFARRVPCAGGGSMRTRSVDRISGDANPATLDALIREGRPVVLERFASKWPARGWTMDALQARAGSWRVPVARTRGRVLHTDVARGLEYDDESMVSFLDRVREPATEGYVAIPTDSIPPAWRDELRTPAELANASWLRSKLWIGGTGTVSPMHWDIPHNVHVQLYGRKRFTLAPPGHWRSMYPFPWWSGIANRSQVDPDSDIARDWPRFDSVERCVAEIGPGDAIFIPSRWWHHVRTLDHSISVNYWWADGALAAVAWLSDRAKSVRGTSR